MIYLDNSATSYPKPECVYAALSEISKTYGANPGRAGHDMALKTGEKIYESREKSALLFGSSNPENVVFTPNCTYALNFAIKGSLQRGDHVLISDFEHNSVVRPLEKLRRSGYIFCESVTTDPYDCAETVRRFKRKIRRNTKMIVCSHAGNVFGFINPINELGKLCAGYGITFVVDAAQSAGIIPIDIKKNNINWLCVPGHKGLMGFMGTGVLIGNNYKKINSVIEGGTGSKSFDKIQPDFMPDIFESGTVNVPGVLVLSKSIEFLEETGINEINLHEKKLIRILYDELKKMEHIQLYYNIDKAGDYAPILSFNVKNVQSEEAAAALNEDKIYVRAGLHCAPSAHRKAGTLKQGTVRISPSFFTTEEDIYCAICSIKNLKNRF